MRGMKNDWERCAMRRTAAGVVMATEMVWPLRTPKSWTLYSGCSLNYADFNLLITTD